MRANKVAIVILLGLAATAFAGEERKHPLENKKAQGGGQQAESWQVKYDKDYTGQFKALQMKVSVTQQGAASGCDAIAVNLVKYDRVVDNKYVAADWGSLGKTITLTGFVQQGQGSQQNKFKRQRLWFWASGTYVDRYPHQVTVTGFVMMNKRKQQGGATDQAPIVAVTLRDREIPLGPRPKSDAAVVGTLTPCEKDQAANPPSGQPGKALGWKDRQDDPCEGVAAEDILEEGDFVPAEEEFTYPGDYELPELPPSP